MKGSLIAGAVLVALTVALSLWGFLDYHPPASASGILRPDVLDAVWGTFALFTVDLGGADPRFLPWQLEIARIAAPVLAAGGALVAVFVAGHRSLRRFRIRTGSGHTIVCGTDEASLFLARSATTRTVVAAALLDATALELQGISTLQGDASDPALLASLGAERARFITALGPDEALNTAIALAAADAGAREKVLRTRIVVNVRDPRRRAVLAAAGASPGIDVIVVDLDELAAAQLLADLDGCPLPEHTVVVADEPRAGGILRRLAVLADVRRIEHADAVAPRVTLISASAQRTLADAPYLHDVLAVEALDVEPDRVADAGVWTGGRVERVVIAPASPAEGLVLAEAIGRRLDGATITVDIRTPSEVLHARGKAINDALRPAAIVGLVAPEPLILTLEALAAQDRAGRLRAPGRLHELEAAGEIVVDRAPGAPLADEVGLDRALTGILARAGLQLSDTSPGHHLRVARTAEPGVAVIALAEAITAGAKRNLIEPFAVGDTPASRLARLWLTCEKRPSGSTRPVLVAGAGEHERGRPATLEAWADLVAAGHTPKDVRVLAYPGATARQEVAIARALGARVGLVALAPGKPDGSGAVVKLPDEATIDAWLEPPAPWAPDKLRFALAWSVHQRFRANQRERKLSDDDAMAAFLDLPDALKHSNLHQVDDMARKLRLLGLELVPGAGRPLPEFDEAELERLAEHEHGRWTAERLEDGWLPGPRNIALKTTPHLVAWTELADEYREYDREAMRAIPELLALHGVGVRAHARAIIA